jgi:signal transduction histidine kinase
MAQILHGGVQGRLSSISLALRRYLDDEKSGVNVSLVDLKKRLEFQLMEVRDELSQLTSSNTNTRVDIEVEFRKAVMQWRGLLVISQDIDPSAKSVLTSNDYLSWATSEVLTAAVTNSNLHGQAQNVWITVGINSAPDVSQLEIVIEDDGTGPPGNLIPGMGLGGIDALGGRWQLAPRTDGGCRLSVHLPIN